MREKRGFGPWGWLLLIFGLLVFFSNGGFFADGTNIISPAVAERLNVDQSIILTMNSVAGIVGVLIADKALRPTDAALRYEVAEFLANFCQ